VIADSSASSFFVLSAAGGDTLFEGGLWSVLKWTPSDEFVKLADFSLFREPGDYVLFVPGLGASHPFSIGHFVHQGVTRAGLKSYYFNRASMALDEAYAGPWKRALGHADNNIYVHPSAATTERPEKTLISCPGAGTTRAITTSTS